VCHAVHKAPAGTSEVLLRSTVGDACDFCHIDNNLGLQRLYGGDPNMYSAERADAHNNVSAGAQVGSRCTDCHAVHGADTMQQSTVSSYILRNSTAYTPSGVSTSQAEATAALGATNVHDAQVTVFCTICHPYYNASHNGTISVAVHDAGGNTQSGYFKSHVMSLPGASYVNTPATAVSVKVAWADSSYCRSCHDAGASMTSGQNLNSFPHYTKDYTRFLISAVSTPTGAGLVTTYTLTSPTTGQSDGVCLKCHVSAGAGVGITY
jgi:hypothetical protein